MEGELKSPEVVAGLLTEQEAALIVGHLDSLGIHADIWGEHTAGVAWPDVPRNAQIVVRRADFERAKAELERHQQDRTRNGG